MINNYFYVNNNIMDMTLNLINLLQSILIYNVSENDDYKFLKLVEIIK